MSSSVVNPRTPVLVGAGQFTFRGDAKDCPPILELLEKAISRAKADAGLSPEDFKTADSVKVVGFTVDAPGPIQNLPFPKLKNAPYAISQKLGLSPQTLQYTHMGGNTPQALVNQTAEAIANGIEDFTVISGAEFLGATKKLLATGGDLSAWADPYPDAPAPKVVGDPREGCSEQEAAHGLGLPVNAYPLFENALMKHLGRTVDEHQKALGDLMAPFTEVAATNPYSWFPIKRTPEEISEVSDKNRYVGWPYTKYMNAVMEVNQSAALIMMSTKKADDLRIPNENRVYLHGCSDTYELWNPLDRVNYYTSPAIGVAAREALGMAGKRIDDLSFFDIYSCFPVAVEVAAKEIGIETDDPRGLTLTGGLPYFGGPGNNYALHGIAEIYQKSKDNPNEYGLATANGWYLTKHAMGIYSTEAFKGEWKRKNPSTYQSEIDKQTQPAVVVEPSGQATIETYTVSHGRSGPKRAIIIGREEQDRRFIARTAVGDEASMLGLMDGNAIGKTGTVSSSAGGMDNTFVLD